VCQITHTRVFASFWHPFNARPKFDFSEKACCSQTRIDINKCTYGIHDLRWVTWSHNLLAAILDWILDWPARVLVNYSCWKWHGIGGPFIDSWDGIPVQTITRFPWDHGASARGFYMYLWNHLLTNHVLTMFTSTNMVAMTMHAFIGSSRYEQAGFQADVNAPGLKPDVSVIIWSWRHLRTKEPEIELSNRKSTDLTGYRNVDTRHLLKPFVSDQISFSYRIQKSIEKMRVKKSLISAVTEFDIAFFADQ
jgi:hypothetical protein